MGHILRDSFSFYFIRLFRISLQPCRFTICQQRAREFALWLYIGPKYYKVVLYGLVKSEILSLITMSVGAGGPKSSALFGQYVYAREGKRRLMMSLLWMNSPITELKPNGDHITTYILVTGTGQDRGSHHHVHCHLRIIKFPLAKLCFFGM